jgi:hypothetical protein
MAEKPYRFLLRMPEQLRQKLNASAQRQGRSLNSEVVHRLEESVEQGSETAATRSLRVRVADRFAGGSTPARLRVGVAFAALLVLVGTAATMGILRGDSGKTGAAAARLQPRLEAELPKAVARKLAKSQTFSVTTIREGGDAVSDGAQDYAEHAYPADWIPYGAVKGSRADWKHHGNSGFDEGLGGKWLSLGPDVATYPFNPFRNRFVYVPNEYVAAGRTAHSLIDPDCKPGDCRYWIANAGGGSG